MNKSEQKINNYFSNMKDSVANDIKKIYDDMYQKAITQKSHNIAVAIISEESNQINKYVRNLRQQLKEAAMEAVVNFDISENYSEIIWAKVMNCVSVPSVQLCSSEDIKIGELPNENHNDSSSKINNQRNDIKRKQMVYGGAAALGAVSGTITMLIVPGFRDVVGFLKIAEIIVTGVGVAGVIKTQKEISEINKIYTEEKKNQQRKESIEAVVSEVCQNQCELNINIINAWIDKVLVEFMNQCKSYL